MKLSVVIVNWNTGPLLRACLRSLAAAGIGPAAGAEVIVVDNASTDGSAAMVRAEFPEVVLLANTANVGYAAGNNQGLRLARGKAVLLLNPDTEVPSGAIEKLLGVLAAHPEVGAVAPRLVEPDGRVQASVRGFPAPAALLAEGLGLARLFPRRRRLGGYRLRYWALDDEIEVEQPMMSCLLIRREALDHIGLLDEAFPIFFNDVDWCYRARQAGWRIRFTPQAQVLHYGGASTRQVRREMIRESGRSLARFYHKHYRSQLAPPLYAFCLLAIHAGTALRELWCGLAGTAARPAPVPRPSAPLPAPGREAPGAGGLLPDSEGNGQAENPDLIVSIINWNTRDDLEKCLRSIFASVGIAAGPIPPGAQPRPPKSYRVAVVDNASSDGSAERVAECFPQVLLVRNRENRGFAAANNQVLKGSRSRYVLLLNPDTEVHPGALAALVRFMDANPEVGICGPLVLNPDGSVQYSARRFPTLLAGAFRNTFLGRLFPNNRYTREYLLSDWDHRTQRDVDWLSGAAMMIRREVIDQVGVLDEQFFMYSEDMDLCFRARQAGWRVTFFPDAVITHARAHSSDQAQVRMLVQFHRSTYRFWRKHYAPRSSLPVRALVPLGILLRLVLVLAKNLTDRIRGELRR